MIKFGPSGLGGAKQAVSNLKSYSKSGLKACEIAFTYGIYLKNKEDIEKIKKTAEQENIKLSIHAPYWINLNSREEEKVMQSKKRILRCCEIGGQLGAYLVIFHPGFYSGKDKQESYENIKKSILEIQQEIKKRNLKIKIAPETTGKLNVFGSIQEISDLVRDTECSFCLDFAHIKARYKKINFEEIKNAFKEKDWHCHFSGIEYGEKGEKRHIKTSAENWKELLKKIPKNKNLVIINESPYPVEDSVLGLSLL